MYFLMVWQHKKIMVLLSGLFTFWFLFEYYKLGFGSIDEGTSPETEKDTIWP